MESNVLKSHEQVLTVKIKRHLKERDKGLCLRSVLVLDIHQLDPKILI